MEKYTIDFKTMIETCEKNRTQRQVSRHTDFNFPQYWQVQSENIVEFPVQKDSNEFNEIRALFDSTMANKYTEIRINRIQNKPWYIQYNSYKSFSTKKDTEKRLFHGSSQQSIQLIIHSFFNRSFAGVNGLFKLLYIYLIIEKFYFKVLFMVKELIFQQMLHIVTPMHTLTH